MRNRNKGSLAMAVKFEEVISVKVPKGTREELTKLAQKRYLTACTIARTAIMAEIEKARREEKPAA
jgi:predicted transcriptional regulator